MGLHINLKKVTEPLKKAVQKTAQAVKNVATKAVDKAKDILAEGKLKAAVLLFTPFVPLAKVYLKRRGITPAGDTKGVLLQTYLAKSTPGFGYGDMPDVFDTVDTEDLNYGLTNDQGESIAGLAVSGAASSQGIPITPDMATAVIKFLKGIFDSIKKKKASGQPLSADEQQIADAAPQIEAELSTAASSADTVIKDAQTNAGNVANQGVNDAAVIQANGQSEIDSILGGANSTWKVAAVVLLLVLLFLFIRSRR